MNYVERVIDCPTMKAMLNELSCGFGRATNRITINAVCHTPIIDLLDT